jgi:hypothetical protein
MIKQRDFLKELSKQNKDNIIKNNMNKEERGFSHVME